MTMVIDLTILPVASHKRDCRKQNDAQGFLRIISNLLFHFDMITFVIDVVAIVVAFARQG